MKKLQVLLLVTTISFCATSFASGSKQTPPSAMSFFDQIIAMFTITG